jgi:hypothetical protein
MKTENKVVSAGLGLHIHAEEGTEALAPLRAWSRQLVVCAVLFVKSGGGMHRQRRHMRAYTAEGLVAVAHVGYMPFFGVQAKPGGEKLQIIALHAAVQRTA